jgi:hypothetical protein
MIALAVLLNHPAAQVLFTPRVHLTQQHRLDEPSPSKDMRVVGPYCPTEDSCAVDYSNGKWTVTEVTP